VLDEDAAHLRVERRGAMHDLIELLPSPGARKARSPPPHADTSVTKQRAKALDVAAAALL
jgi:hypothetical protein